MEREGMTVLVAGGTGTAGTAHVEALVGAGYRVKATIRPGKDTATLVRMGAEPVEVDLRHPEAAVRALEGVNALVVAVLGRGPDGVRDEEFVTRNLVDGARAAGVFRLVYTSVYLADEPTGVPHFEVKGRVEDYVRKSGLRHTFLRPATFMEGLNAPWIRASVEERGVLASPIALETPISYVSAADVARFAVLALEDEALEGATLNLGGPEAVTYTDLLSVMSELLGHRVEYQRVRGGHLVRGKAVRLPVLLQDPAGDRCGAGCWGGSGAIQELRDARGSRRPVQPAKAVSRRGLSLRSVLRAGE